MLCAVVAPPLPIRKTASIDPANLSFDDGHSLDFAVAPPLSLLQITSTTPYSCSEGGILRAGIPFRYECKITVVDENGWEVELCPDFMIQCYDGTMIIIEHLGGLKSAKYRSDLTAKLYYYQKKGYVIGDNLFLTSDDADHNTSSEMIARKVQEIEKMFYRAA